MILGKRSKIREKEFCIGALGSGQPLADYGVQNLFQAGKRGAKTAVNLLHCGVPAQKLFKPKSETQNSIQPLSFSRNFPFPKLSFKHHHIPFAGSGSSHCANPLLRARRISVGSGKFDFANRLSGVGEFAFCGGSRRDIAMLRHLRFPAVSPYLPARGKSPECRAVAVSHSELRISFYSAIKKYFQSKIRALKPQMPPSGLPQFFWVFRRFAYIFRRPLNVRGTEVGKRGRAFFSYAFYPCGFCLRRLPVFLLK